MIFSHVFFSGVETCVVFFLWFHPRWLFCETPKLCPQGVLWPFGSRWCYWEIRYVRIQRTSASVITNGPRPRRADFGKWLVCFDVFYFIKGRVGKSHGFFFLRCFFFNAKIGKIPWIRCCEWTVFCFTDCSLVIFLLLGTSKKPVLLAKTVWLKVSSCLVWSFGSLGVKSLERKPPTCCGV